MTIRETLERIEVMREMFPKCFYCGEPVTEAPGELHQTAVVVGHNRLAHLVCPPERPADAIA